MKVDEDFLEIKAYIVSMPEIAKFLECYFISLC